jgi:hypothetical protein
MTDVSRSVLFHITGVAYDRSKHAIALTARLKNTSRRPIATPLVLRMTDMRSELGVPSVLNADNGETYEGATWMFLPAAGRTSLAPGAATAERTLSFALSDVIPFEPEPNFQLGNGGFPGMLEVQGTVLAPR